MDRDRIHDEAAVSRRTCPVVGRPSVVVAESPASCHRWTRLRVNAYIPLPSRLHRIAFAAESDPEARESPRIAERI
jgi:hypothetical protein